MKKEILSPVMRARIGAGIALTGLIIATLFGATACENQATPTPTPTPTPVTLNESFMFGTQKITIKVAEGVTLTEAQIIALNTEFPKVNSTLIPRFNEITSIEITGISTDGGMSVTSPDNASFCIPAFSSLIRRSCNSKYCTIHCASYSSRQVNALTASCLRSVVARSFFTIVVCHDVRIARAAYSDA